MKLTTRQRARKAGKARWAKISKKERTEEMRKRANQLWEKIRSGKLTTL